MGFRAGGFWVLEKVKEKGICKQKALDKERRKVVKREWLRLLATRIDRGESLVDVS